MAPSAVHLDIDIKGAATGHPKKIKQRTKKQVNAPALAALQEKRDTEREEERRADQKASRLDAEKKIADRSAREREAEAERVRGLKAVVDRVELNRLKTEKRLREEAQEERRKEAKAKQAGREAERLVAERKLRALELKLARSRAAKSVAPTVVPDAFETPVQVVYSSPPPPARSSLVQDGRKPSGPRVSFALPNKRSSSARSKRSRRSSQSKQSKRSKRHRGRMSAKQVATPIPVPIAAHRRRLSLATVRAMWETNKPEFFAFLALFVGALVALGFGINALVNYFNTCGDGWGQTACPEGGLTPVQITGIAAGVIVLVIAVAFLMGVPFVVNLFKRRANGPVVQKEMDAYTETLALKLDAMLNDTQSHQAAVILTQALLEVESYTGDERTEMVSAIDRIISSRDDFDEWEGYNVNDFIEEFDGDDDNPYDYPTPEELQKDIMLATLTTEMSAKDEDLDKWWEDTGNGLVEVHKKELFPNVEDTEIKEIVKGYHDNKIKFEEIDYNDEEKEILKNAIAESKLFERTLIGKVTGVDEGVRAKVMANGFGTKDAPAQVLLYGAPGTGKTEIAKAVMGEWDKVHQRAVREAKKKGENPPDPPLIFTLAGKDMGALQGQGATKATKMFRVMRNEVGKGRKVFLLMDEIDTIMSDEALKGTLLGLIENNKEYVSIIATTNNFGDYLSGGKGSIPLAANIASRFNAVEIPLPSPTDRISIFASKLKSFERRVEHNINSKQWAELSRYELSGRALTNIARGFYAQFKENNKPIQFEDVRDQFRSFEKSEQAAGRH